MIRPTMGPKRVRPHSTSTHEHMARKFEPLVAFIFRLSVTSLTCSDLVERQARTMTHFSEKHTFQCSREAASAPEGKRERKSRDVEEEKEEKDDDEDDDYD